MSQTDFKAGVSLLGGTLVYYLGSWDIALRALVIFVVTDYVAGVFNAWIEKKLNSTVGAKGIAKKVGFFILVAMATQVDMLIGKGSMVRSVVIMFLIANEGISISENLALLGVPVPDTLRRALEVWKEADTKKPGA